MKWYEDQNKNVLLGFPGSGFSGSYIKNYQKERQILRVLLDSCYHDGYDLFSTLEKFCVTDAAQMISEFRSSGYFYSVGRIIQDIERTYGLKRAEESQDIVIFHWIIDMYLTARFELGMSYFNICKKYPPEVLYAKFSPLHETSESNALSKISCDELDLCGCFLNDNWYLHFSDIPVNKQHLLKYESQAEYRMELIYMNTVFFHLTSEPNGYLSNWYPSEFVLEGITFNCVEQYMMWKKAMLFHDTSTAQNILNSSDPATMKDLGRKVEHYADSLWASKRYIIVRDAVYAKFSQNEELKKQLLSTSGLFAECAVNDIIWGIGLSMQDVRRFDRLRWQGENLLGFALQEVYNQLIQEASGSCDIKMV